MTEILTPREILQALISFPTISTDSNLALVDWTEVYLRGHGIECHRFWNEDRQKAALMAHAGPRVPGAVVLSGHSDVVPVQGQAWSQDPWTLTERDGKLFGRGTCDMKGYVALAIWALVEAQRHGAARPLQLALSYDEELGCTGAPPMIAAMQDLLPKGDIALIGEPSGMAVINGHKSGSGFKVLVRGYEVHSSLLPYGVSAVMEGARFIQWVNDLNVQIQARPVSPIAAAFDPPFTTLHVGTIKGGTAENITAAECHFAVEVRVVPGESEAFYDDLIIARAAQMDGALKTIRLEAGVTLTTFLGVPALMPEPNGAAEALARHLTGDNSLGVVSYGTEAGQFQAAGYSAVVCGPGYIAQAHQADEFISLAEFDKGHRFMQALLAWLG